MIMKEVTPGQRAVDLSPELGGGAALIYDGVPDVVRLPAEINPSRPTVRTAGGFKSACPCRSCPAPVLHIRLDYVHGNRPVFVAECVSGRGFMWYQPTPEQR